MLRSNEQGEREPRGPHPVRAICNFFNFDQGQQNNDDQPQQPTLIEAARLMGVSTQTVRRLIQREILNAQQSMGPHGLRWEIDRSEVARYLEAHRGGQQPQQPLSSNRVDHYQHPNRTPTATMLSPTRRN